MKYRKDRYGNDISLLGYGCMRFTLKNGKIDVDKAEKEVMKAFEAGVNYYDCAYTYPGIEAALGEILDRNQIRDKINIATKLPHYLIKKPEDTDKYFREELRRLRTDHVDYYLMHMLTDMDTWERLIGLGVKDWIEERKAAGEIRQIGFSYHGNTEMFIKLLNAYDWDFCQIQYNYLDETSQAGRQGLMAAAEKGIPVVIMEPLRGGRLTDRLPQEALKLFESFPVKRTPAEWSFRWLYDQPQVTCVLSGMNAIPQVEENVKIASETEANCMDDAERKLLKDVLEAINSKMKVGCTGCRYCMPCPHQVDIPGTFSAYNRLYTDGLYPGLKEYAMCALLRKNPTVAKNCVGCGACEKHCPQHIEIRKELKNASRKLDNPLVWIFGKIVRLFMKY